MVANIDAELQQLIENLGVFGKERAMMCFEALLSVGITKQHIIDNFVIVNYSPGFDFRLGLLEIISEKWNDLACSGIDFNKSTIPNLKKRIKHSKNPMEKKMLEKELNALYKERKHK